MSDPGGGADIVSTVTGLLSSLLGGGAPGPIPKGNARQTQEGTDARYTRANNARRLFAITSKLGAPSKRSPAVGLPEGSYTAIPQQMVPDETQTRLVFEARGIGVCADLMALVLTKKCEVIRVRYTWNKAKRASSKRPYKNSQAQ